MRASWGRGPTGQGGHRGAPGERGTHFALPGGLGGSCPTTHSSQACEGGSSVLVGSPHQSPQPVSMALVGKKLFADIVKLGISDEVLLDYLGES